jgi:hypothetical protein
MSRWRYTWGYVLLFEVDGATKSEYFEADSDEALARNTKQKREEILRQYPHAKNLRRSMLKG